MKFGALSSLVLIATCGVAAAQSQWITYSSATDHFTVQFPYRVAHRSYSSNLLGMKMPSELYYADVDALPANLAVTRVSKSNQSGTAQAFIDQTLRLMHGTNVQQGFTTIRNRQGFDVTFLANKNTYCELFVVMTNGMIYCLHAQASSLAELKPLRNHFFGSFNITG
jgi:hypothetical protein